MIDLADGSDPTTGQLGIVDQNPIDGIAAIASRWALSER